MEDLEIISVENNLYGNIQAGVMPKGVRVMHKPTGIIAFCAYGRSQLKNRNTAMTMVEWGLEDIGWKDNS